jgi:hypothetical protein
VAAAAAAAAPVVQVQVRQHRPPFPAPPISSPLPMPPVVPDTTPVRVAAGTAGSEAPRTGLALPPSPTRAVRALQMPSDAAAPRILARGGGAPAARAPLIALPVAAAQAQAMDTGMAPTARLPLPIPRVIPAHQQAFTARAALAGAPVVQPSAPGAAAAAPPPPPPAIVVGALPDRASTPVVAPPPMPLVPPPEAFATARTYRRPYLGLAAGEAGVGGEGSSATAAPSPTRRVPSIRDLEAMEQQTPYRRRASRTRCLSLSSDV